MPGAHFSYNFSHDSREKSQFLEKFLCIENYVFPIHTSHIFTVKNFTNPAGNEVPDSRFSHAETWSGNRDWNCTKNVPQSRSLCGSVESVLLFDATDGRQAMKGGQNEAWLMWRLRASNGIRQDVQNSVDHPWFSSVPITSDPTFVN